MFLDGLLFSLDYEDELVVELGVELRNLSSVPTQK